MKLAHALMTLPLLAVLTGCSAAGSGLRPEAPGATIAQSTVPVLTRSLYSKDPSGSLSETDLQRVLESPIDLEFPARVGVVPLSEPFEAKGPVAIGTRSVAARDLARSLVGHPHFSHVSDISTDLPNVGGIEGLRTIAARYRLRYLLLYSERFEDATHLNGWAWLYPTVIGMFIAPGVTVESSGIAQADLLDVRTGTVLFSVVQPMEVSRQEWMIGAARSHKQHQADAASKAAKALAKRVATQTNELVAWADHMALAQAQPRTRILPAPVKADPAASQAITGVMAP
jgi:rhombotail lipoprotein